MMQVLSMASLWAVTILWNVVTLLACVDAVQAYRHDRHVYRLTEGLTNGRALVARFRLRIAWWFLLGFLASEVVGLIALLRLLTTAPTAIDVGPFSLIVSTFLRLLLVFVVFAFWRAKKNTREMKRDAYERHDRRQDARQTSQDARGVSQDERAVRQDVRSVSQTERGSLQDARGDKQDEREARQNERRGPERDPERDSEGEA
jgi:uncharacterized membrane protein